MLYKLSGKTHFAWPLLYVLFVCIFVNGLLGFLKTRKKVILGFLEKIFTVYLSKESDVVS